VSLSIFLWPAQLARADSLPALYDGVRRHIRRHPEAAPTPAWIDELARLLPRDGGNQDQLVLGPEFRGLFRYADGVIAVQLMWDAVAAVGPEIAAFADRHGLALFAPDAAPLGEDPSGPNWERLERRALVESDRAFRAGHGMVADDV